MERKDISTTLVFWCADTPGLNATFSYAASDLTKLSKVKTRKRNKIFEKCWIFPCGNENAERRRSRKSTAVRQQSTEWSGCGRSISSVLVFVFQLDPVVCTYVIDHVYILSFDLLRILFAPDLPVRNYCISRGVYIYIYIYTYTHTHCRIRCGFLPFADFPVCASRSSPLPLPNHVTTHPYPAVPPPMPIKEQNNYT